MAELSLKKYTLTKWVHWPGNNYTTSLNPFILSEIQFVKNCVCQKYLGKRLSI